MDGPMAIAMPDGSLKMEVGLVEPNEIHGDRYYHNNDQSGYTPEGRWCGLKLIPLPGDDEIEKEKQKQRLIELIQKRKICNEQTLLRRKLTTYWNRYLEHRENMTLMRRSITQDWLANKEIIFFAIKGFFFDYSNIRFEMVDETIVWRYYMALLTVSFTFGTVFGPSMTMIYSFFLGPLAIFLTCFQVLNASHYLAIRDCKRDKDKIPAKLLANVFTITNMGDLLTDTLTGPQFAADHIIKFWRDLNNTDFYVETLPDLLITSTIEILDYAFVALCSYIPFFGMLLVRFIFTAQNGFAYFRPYYKEVKKMSDKEVRRVYYQNYARWFLFGIGSSLVESIPIISGHFVPKIFVGASLWASGDLTEEIKERTAKYGPLKKKPTSTTENHS